jgi:hypothetical protein
MGMRAGARNERASRQYRCLSALHLSGRFYNVDIFRIPEWIRGIYASKSTQKH